MIAAGAGERIKNLPQLKGLGLPALGGDGTYSGPLVTKTLLMYALTTGGTDGGPRVVALDKGTGRELASADLPGVAIGLPMTYLAVDASTLRSRYRAALRATFQSSSR
jgi:hypothetical protein